MIFDLDWFRTPGEITNLIPSRDWPVATVATRRLTNRIFVTIPPGVSRMSIAHGGSSFAYPPPKDAILTPGIGISVTSLFHFELAKDGIPVSVSLCITRSILLCLVSTGITKN